MVFRDRRKLMLINKLNFKCVVSTLEALKSIANAGIQTDVLLKKLNDCINDDSGYISNEVKVAAIEAHRRFGSCERIRDEYFLDIYRNNSIDTELRIASYLQVMRCPDYKVVKIIRRTLEEEEVNQVGSFVWSHLKNVLSSSSPTRIEIQSLLTDHNLGNKFNNDMRKFSRNYETSFYSEEYNIGGNYQMNLVFSPKSYIPRTFNFNITVELFGEAINLFELNLRTEGLEYYAENIFGPDGPLSGMKMSKHIHQVLRQFRSASDQFDEHGSDYWRKIRNLPNVIDNNFNNPRISYSYKIFGNEIKFVILNSNNEIQRNILNLNPWEKIKQVLSGKEMIHYENTAMFLDWSYVIPTTSGVPIKLDMTGSAACNIKLSGILNSQKFISDGELDINGNVMPSMNMDLTGSMIVDAFYKSAGIKVKSSLYSVSAAEVEFKLRRLELARLIWKIPKQIMEVFSLTTDVLLITTNGAEYKEISIDNLHHNLLLDPAHSKNVSLKIIKNRTCSWSALDRLIGLKMCIDYQLPNITKDENHSLFLLNGLTVFKLLLIKADSTATSYLLEYKWTRNKNESTLKVAFDTPGSQSPREISATISFIRLNNSVLLLLKSKGNSLIAQGNYRRTDDETFINLALDTNGTKQLEASIGYFIKKTKHGYIYSPKVLLSINNEGIVNLSGIIKNQDKGNLSQCDVDMRFETKHLSSHLYGYVLKGNVSTTGNVKIEYKLNGKIKDDVLHIEFALINRSTITQTYKAADLKLHSTAYPQLNIITGLQYQHVLGHVELFLELNTSPHLYNAERHKLTLQFIATYSKPYFQTDGANVSAYVVIIKPAQNIDIKIGASYYSIASESKTDLLVRYAPEKEITLVINLIIPRRSLFIMEGRVNLTIPKYDSMLIQMNITERRRNKFVLNFTGTWFSGQNISADGIYSDCSTVVIANHDFKITFQSPSFATDIVLNGSFFYDTTDIKIGLSAEQINAGTYALLLNHTSISQSQFYTYLEGKYKHNVYSIISNLDMQSQIIFLIHLDKWRDIYVAAMGINSKLSKEYGMEVKWDANRDPSLKISINGQLNNLKYTDKCKNVSLAISILYPGRLIKGYTLFMASNEAKKYLTDMQLQWSANKKIALTIVTEHEIENNNKLLKFESQIQTPYNDWKKTSINGKYLQTESDVAATTSIYWQNTQHLILELFSKIEMQEVDTMWKFDCGFLSTVHKMHYIRANITHLHVHDKSYNSLITINYFPNKRMEIESVWLIVYKQNQIFNITGNLQFLSPVHNFRKGELKCHFSLMTNWKVYGSAILDLDKRKYTSNLIGDLAKLKESMIHFNVTSPFEKYAHIRSRFGLSESNRHIVAEIVTPTSALGIEGIFQINTDIYNFNIKLLVATSIDIIQKALIVAKLNHKEADFRIAYNNLTAGFEGVWSYNNITDFHYSYILYTPFPGFQEIGIITKLIVLAPSISNIFTIESEFSIRIVELLAGIKINAGPKSTPPSIVIAMKPQLSGIKKYSIRDVYNSTEDLENYFYWKAEIEQLTGD